MRQNYKGNIVASVFLMYKLSTYFFPLKVDFFLFYLQAQTIKETIRGKNGELQGTAVTTVRGNKSVTVYKDKYGKITGRSESTTNSQGKPHTVYRDQYGQRTGTSTTSIKNPGTSSTTTTVYRDKYGQRTGTSTTRQTGNSSTTTYKDKYGRIQKRGNSLRK